MKIYSTGGIFISLLLVFSVFTLFSITNVNAEEVISVNTNGYENTIIIEFENNSESAIKTVRMWAGGETTIESFKSEPGWGGGKYSDGKLIIFTATNVLNPGESVKFGLVTSEKIDGINWKMLGVNDNTVGTGKTSIKTISETKPDFSEEEGKEIEQAKEIGGQLYGTKKFIPEKIRAGSDVRLVGNGFSQDQDLKLYLDDTMLQSVSTDEQGNFLTTLSIPDNQNIGTNEFIIKDEFGDIQSSNINIDQAKNRILKDTKFKVDNIPGEVRYEETLTISGVAAPQTAVVIMFENMDRILEKARVINVDTNGEWVFEENVDRSQNTGERYVIITNNQHKTTKNLNVKSDYLVQISLPAMRYNHGDTVNITGSGEPSENTTVWIKDEVGTIMHYDTFTSPVTGDLNYEFTMDDEFTTGTYSAILKQKNGIDANLFGVGQYPTVNIIALMEKSNFTLNSKAMLNIIGPSASTVGIKILDDDDNIEFTDSITTSSTGKSKYAIDLDGFSSGIYRAVISSASVQDSVKFSVGLEPGSGAISLITIKENYTPGESILVLGSTGVDARITITLYDPSGQESIVTETFSDGAGSFSTNQVGIPTDGELGLWKITAHSRLDTTSVDINVSVPTDKGLTIEIEDTEFSIEDTVTIKGAAQSDSNRLEIRITNENGENIASLETPITSDGTFSLPWVIPEGIPTGTYTITINDAENSDSVEIFIQ